MFSLLQVIGAATIPTVVTVAQIVRRRRARPPTYPSYYVDWNQTRAAPSELEANAKPARELFVERAKAYQATLDVLGKNSYYWVLLIGLTILILSKGGAESFELLSTPIPAAAIRTAVVSSMLFLWMQFGWTLRHLIFERMTLWKMADRIEGPLIGGQRTVQLSSLRPMLHGSGFIDNWFATFLPEFALAICNEGKVNWFLNKVILGASALLIGLAHASAFALLWDAERLWGTSPALAWTLWAAQVLTVIVIVLCYLYFVIEGHGQWFFVCCGWAASVWIMTLPLLTALRSPEATSAARDTPVCTDAVGWHGHSAAGALVADP